MKANRAAARRADEGVSSVVAAVMLFALFATLFTMYTVTTLPKWIAANEVEHARAAKQSMDALKAALDASAATDSQSSISATFRLAPETVPLLQSTSFPGTLSLGPGFEIQGAFTSPEVFLAGGQVAAQPTCSVGAAATTDCPSMSGVDSLHGLLVGLSTTGVNAASAAAGVRLTVTDSSSPAQTVQLDLQHANSGATPALGCGGRHLRTTLTYPSGTPRYSLVQCGLDASIPTAYPYDMLESSNGLRAAIASLTPPLAVALTSPAGSNGASATAVFAAAWTGDDGLDRVAGTGRSQAYALEASSHVLSFATAAQQTTPETLLYQGGAVVRDQPDGQAVATDPAFSLAVAGGQGYLSWTLPVLDASGSASGGQGVATLTPRSVESVLLTAQGGTLTVTSDQAAAWQAFLRAARLATATGAYTSVAGDDATAQLTLSPSLRWTVRITVVHVTATIS